MTAEVKYEEAFGYAWAALRTIANGDTLPGESPAACAARNMEGLRKHYPAATEGLEAER